MLVYLVSWYEILVYMASVLFRKERFTHLDRTFHTAGYKKMSFTRSQICLWMDRSNFEIKLEGSGLGGTSRTRKCNPLEPYRGPMPGVLQGFLGG